MKEISKRSKWDSADGGDGERCEPRRDALTRPGHPDAHRPPILLHRLMKLANLVIRPCLARHAEAHRMSLNEMKVLMTLASLGEAAGHELSEVAGIHPMNVSRAVGALRRQGRVVEQRDESNRRRKLLRLTAEGRRIFEALAPDADRAAERLFVGMDERALRNLSRMIDRLTKNAVADA